MKQLTQILKNGRMNVLEVPVPRASGTTVLVRNHFSVISTGTEGRTVRDARRGYLSKARARREEVRKTIRIARKQGLLETFRMVMSRLELPSSLGYSCAGEIIEIGPQVKGLQVGDLVACGGTGAFHAEVVSAPGKLCARIPEGVDPSHACFTTVGAIALQGVRRADLRLGECCVVIGLGLIGQLSVQLLNAAGVRSIGIDTQASRTELAAGCGADLALPRDRPDLEPLISAFTSGQGVDAVIIAAGTSSLDPVELAGRLCREKGKVVVVGAVPTGFGRENYYRKELDLRMSCSYGPGRYDPGYEEKGIDYPIGYVRWTENRNMEAFLTLLSAGKLRLDPLITHRFELENAVEAYDLILRGRSSLGILLKHSAKETPARGRVGVRTTSFRSGQPRVGLIGAGSFAQNVLLPILSRKANLVGLQTDRPHRARGLAERFGFQYCCGRAEEILADQNVNTVFIANRHHEHANWICKALAKGKHIFVEKPLCLTEAQLDAICREYEGHDLHLMVDFNRRFAPHVLMAKQVLDPALPKAIQYRINAGALPPDHWVHDDEIGGGRIVGEVCHFVDLVSSIAASPCKSVSAERLRDGRGVTDSLVVNLTFRNGSVASISYFSNGHQSLPKELLEICSGGQSIVIDDFKRMTVYGKQRRHRTLRRQDKGHSSAVACFLDAVQKGTASPICPEELWASTRATFKVAESIRRGQRICL